MSESKGPIGRDGAPDANGVTTRLATLDEFAGWILETVYRPGVHEDGVERRFVREQLRNVANAALQQAAQRIVATYGEAWRGVAQEILKLRTREPETSLFGAEETHGAGDRKAIFPIVDHDREAEGGAGVE